MKYSWKGELKEQNTVGRENLWNKIPLEGRIYGMKYKWKGRKHRNRGQEQDKNEWASLVGLCQKTDSNILPREGQPAGTIERIFITITQCPRKVQRQGFSLP